MLCYPIINSSDFQPSSSPQGKQRREYRHPQAGRTDFRPADRQRKADVAGEKKKATDNSDITADTAAGFWEQKAIAH